MFSSTRLWTKDGLLGKDGLWDRLAVAVSALCVVHCIGTLVLVALLSSAAGAWLDPAIHEVGIGIAVALGLFTLGRGVLEHGYIMPAAVGGLGLGVMMGALSVGHEAGATHGGAELVYTMLGVGILALGHDLNYRATH